MMAKHTVLVGVSCFQLRVLVHRGDFHQNRAERAEQALVLLLCRTQTLYTAELGSSLFFLNDPHICLDDKLHLLLIS